MSIVVTCPQCQERIELPGELADQPVQCQRCLNVFERNGKAAVGIQAGPAPATAPIVQPLDEEPIPSLPHREARAPFPLVPLLILLLGFLFFVLVASVGFNVWFILSPEHGFRLNPQIQRAEAMAQQQRVLAEQAAKTAEMNKKQAELVQAQLQKQIEDLRQKLAALQKKAP